MQTLKSLFEEIASDTANWSYYKDCSLDIKCKWNNNKEALDFIEKYFDYAGKSQCFKDINLDKNRQFVEERARHIISTFLIGIKLFECFKIDTKSRDEKNMDMKYYWFLTCLYHDVGYAFEESSKCEQLRMLQSDGIEAIQEIADIKYLHTREFKTFSIEEIDLYLRGRAQCGQARKGCIDHGIIGGLLLYDKLRRQFEISWKERICSTDCRESFKIKDECRDRTLHLSNSHYEAYARVADAIMTHNIFLSTFNNYIEQYDTIPQIKSRTEKDRISLENHICFILSIADTIEPLKRNIKLTDISIESIEDLPNKNGVRIEINSNVKDTYTKNINKLSDWINIEVHDNVLSNSKKLFTLSLPNHQ